ncbi:MAG: hypothetical protein AAF602_10060 [Myxococcota bacterium]
MTLSSLLLTGCFIFGGGNDDESGDTGAAVDCEVNEDINGAPAAGTPSGAVADGLNVFISAQFRLDDNGEVGSLDDVDADGNLLSGVLLQVVPAADPPNTNQGGCTIIIPITPDTTTVDADPASGVWSAQVAAFRSDIDSNCADPAYSTIQQYAGGDVAGTFDEIVTLTLGDPSTAATDFLTSIEGAAIQNFALGGSIQLGPNSPMSDMAVLADSTDECGVLDDDSERIRANRVLNNGPVNGVYRYFGLAPLILTFTPAQ